MNWGYRPKRQPLSLPISEQLPSQEPLGRKPHGILEASRELHRFLKDTSIGV